MAAFHPVRYHAGVLSIIFASKSKTVRQVGVLLVGVGIVLCIAGLFVPNSDPNQTTAEPPTSTPMDIPTSSVAAATPTTTTTAATDTNAADDAPIALVGASLSYVRDRSRTATHTARKIRPSTNAMVGDVAVLNL